MVILTNSSAMRKENNIIVCIEESGWLFFPVAVTTDVDENDSE